MSVLTQPLNGRPQRKQLSDQLDRLDGIIDCLADGLNQAVTDAVRDGSQAALRQLIQDGLTNPATLDLLRHALAANPAPATPSRTSLFLTRCKAGITSAVSVVADTVTCVVATVTARTASVMRVCRLGWHLKRAVAVALGVGTLVGAVALVSHPVATLLSGVGAAVATFGVQTSLWIRRTARPWIA